MQDIPRDTLIDQYAFSLGSEALFFLGCSAGVWGRATTDPLSPAHEDAPYKQAGPCRLVPPTLCTSTQLKDPSAAK